MAWVLSYFSFGGRKNRQRYWLTALAVGGIMAVAALVLSVLTQMPVIGLVFGILLIGAIGAGVVAVLANGARRLHDRGKSAWWLMLFMGLPTLLSSFGNLMTATADEAAVGAGAAVTVLGLPFSIWGLVVMGFLKGTVGPNKYGEDPIGQPVQEILA